MMVYIFIHQIEGAVLVVIVWWLDLQLHMQSVPITTNSVSSNLTRGNVYPQWPPVLSNDLYCVTLILISIRMAFHFD
jgi:hypothetical protein